MQLQMAASVSSLGVGYCDVRQDGKKSGVTNWGGMEKPAWKARDLSEAQDQTGGQGGKKIKRKWRSKAHAPALVLTARGDRR